MSDLECAAILGLGLMGGSLARDLAARGVRVLGYDADAATLRATLDAGVVDAALPASLAGLEDADVAVLAVPVRAAAGLLARIRPGGRLRLVTDMGSTKRSIVAAAETLELGRSFVGAHPLAGDHRSGWRAARTGLFASARVYLCPAAQATGEARRLAGALWEGVGAATETLDPAEHDRRLAWSSHLPQAASSALGRALAGAGVGQWELGAGGRDVVRLSGSSPEMWTDIGLDNADELGPALAAAEGEIARLRSMIEEHDAAGIHAWFAAARAWHGGPVPDA